MVIDYVKVFINGKIIIEYKQRGHSIIGAKQYYRDNPLAVLSSTVALDERLKKKPLTARLKEIFLNLSGQRIVAKKVNWFGEIE